MPTLRNTVDRLDRPSAYFTGKVGLSLLSDLFPTANSCRAQNKKRKLGQREQPQDGEEHRDKSPEESEDPLKDASTLYVGNLSFYTTEEQIHELFAKSVRNLRHRLCSANPQFRCGEIKRLVMGLDRFNKTPCGFCFVEYYTHQDALDCMKYVGGTKLDERIIRTDLDPGFQEGRQYGYD